MDANYSNAEYFEDRKSYDIQNEYEKKYRKHSMSNI